MITVNASLFPSSITNSLIAVGNDGLQERDRMVRACIAIICELGKITEANEENWNGCHQFLKGFSCVFILNSFYSNNKVNLFIN